MDFSKCGNNSYQEGTLRMKQNFDVSVNPDRIIGRIKHLNGGNLGPVMNYAYHPEGNLYPEFSALNIPLTRLHDAPWENPGMHLVDIPQIFPIPTADPEKAENYYFAQTDDYIRDFIDAGTPVMYRLGVSIEHGRRRYFLDPPQDADRWIQICANIIRHLNYGKWNGHHFNIQYWEIWNEPCNWDCDKDGRPVLPKMWNGSLEEFNAFYCKTSAALKKMFPELKFGGPSHGVTKGNIEPFLTACRDSGAPLDFYSWHCYSDDVEWYSQQVSDVRRIVDSFGFTQTELHLNEWHYHPRYPDAYYLEMSVAEQRAFQAAYFADTKGLTSAAFIGAVQTAWQDVPLDMGGYYTLGTSSSYGIFTEHCENTKSYYGMKAFGEIVRYPKRFQVQADKPVYVLGGCNDAGENAVLISAYRSGTGVVRLHFRNDAGGPVSLSGLRVWVLDAEHDLESVAPELKDGVLQLEVTGESAVFLIKYQVQ